MATAEGPSTPGTTPAMSTKPTKPYKDFPLFAHASGQWAKKIKGRLWYFGVWADPNAALRKYLDQRDDLQAGREPGRGDALTVADLCNSFLTAKQLLVDSRDMNPRTWRMYHTTCERIVRQFGAGSKVAALRPLDFATLRSAIAKTRGPVALTTEVQRIRTIFRYAEKAELVDSLVRMGPDFRGASKQALRKAKNERSSRIFTSEELTAVLEAAPCPMDAMIWLALNCGFGQTDIAELPLSAVDLKTGFIRYPRPKTAMRRECALWPKTIEALKRVLETRPHPATPDAEDRFFLARNGQLLVRFLPETGQRIDSIGLRFKRLQLKLGTKRSGVGFYAFRHMFQQFAEESGDFAAVRTIMGHVDPTHDMSQHYRERVSEERLRAVADVVWRHVENLVELDTAKKSGKN